MMENSSIRFFKIITRTDLEDGKLRFPNGFTKKHCDDMPNPLFLKPPDGKEWKIYWNKHEGDIWLQKGWKEFAKYYSLAHGYMILFEYQETFHFVVKVFNKSTLEVEYPFQEKHDNLNRTSEEISVEILEEQLPFKKTRTRPKSPSPCPDKPLKKLRSDQSDQNVGNSSKSRNLPKHVGVEDETDGSTECLKVGQEHLTSKTTEALRTNPFFKFVMTPSYLYNSYLHIPSQFAKKYLKIMESDILIQILDGTTWHAKYCIGRIQGGWKKFVLDNNLKVGDVCVLELTNSQPLTLKVRIFLANQKEPDFTPPQESIQGDDANLIDLARIPNVENKTITTHRGGKETLRTSLWTNPQSFTNEGWEEANKFSSENPFFVVDIKPNRLGDYRPYIPRDFLRKYLDKKHVVLLKFGKKLWSVKLYFIPCRKLTKFSGGWQFFSRENKLQGGDVCVFELINREDNVLHVHIYRDGLELEKWTELNKIQNK